MENENLARSWHFEFELVRRIPPPPWKMKIWPDLGTLSLSWSGEYPPPPWKMKIWPDLGTLSLSWSGEYPPPPLENENLARSWHFEFELVRRVPPLPPQKK